MRKAAAETSVSPKRASIGKKSVGTTTAGTAVGVGVGVGGTPGPNGRAPNPVTWACAALLNTSRVNARQAARTHDAMERLIKGFRVPWTTLPVLTLPRPDEP